MTRLPRFFVYLLLSREDGLVYAGYTAKLRRRFKQHNSARNKGWTRGRRWHLLAVKCFLDRESALLFERKLKHSRFAKRSWIRHTPRLQVLRLRYGIPSPLPR